MKAYKGNAMVHVLLQYSKTPSEHPHLRSLHLHCELATIPVSIINAYNLVSRHSDYVVWSQGNDSEVMDTKYIRDPVTFKTLPNGNIAFNLPVLMQWNISYKSVATTKPTSMHKVLEQIEEQVALNWTHTTLRLKTTHHSHTDNKQHAWRWRWFVWT